MAQQAAERCAVPERAKDEGFPHVIPLDPGGRGTQITRFGHSMSASGADHEAVQIGG